jgi:hypothetical protein
MTNIRVPIAPPRFHGIAAIYGAAEAAKTRVLESFFQPGVPADLAAACRIGGSCV